MSDTEERIQLVTFQLGEELYGIDIMDVREIVRIRDVRPIPNAPPYVQGIINLRGAIIPIIDLHRRFRLKKPVLSEEDRLLSGFLIIDVNGTQLGIFIDRVSRVVSVDSAEVHSPPQMLSGIGKEYIRGVTNQKNGYLILLDVKRLFEPKELHELGALGA